MGDGRLKHDNRYSIRLSSGQRFHGEGVSPVGLLLDLGAGSLAVYQVRCTSLKRHDSFRKIH